MSQKLVITQVVDDKPTASQSLDWDYIVNIYEKDKSLALHLVTYAFECLLQDVTKHDEYGLY